MPDLSNAVASPKPRLKRSPELADQICDLISEGFSLRYACSELGIHKRFVMDWAKEDPKFADQYAYSRERQIECEAEALIELADSATPITANAVRLQVDTRKWVAAKLLPKKYGDVPQVQVNNTTNILVVTEEKRAKILAQLDRLESANPKLANEEKA